MVSSTAVLPSHRGDQSLDVFCFVEQHTEAIMGVADLESNCNALGSLFQGLVSEMRVRRHHC